MKSRENLPALRQLLAEFPAVALLGPRQVGKTTVALDVAKGIAGAIYLDLESPRDAAKLSDPESFFALHSDKLVVLDEVQRLPGLFAILRSVIDARRRAGRRAGQFLLLGSANGALLQQSSESLAGRLATMELTPFLASEVAHEVANGVAGNAPAHQPNDATGLDRLWLRGGFPDAYLARSDAASQRWRGQFIRTYLERDIPQLGPRIAAETLRRFWTMLAHEQGQMLQAAKMAAALAVSGQTVARYLDLMCDLMLVRRLQPWVSHAGKRLVRTPKVYVRDSGLVHSLLGLTSLDAVLAHPVAGGSWEGLIIENLIAMSPAGTQAFFYRSPAGAEVDLVLELPGGMRWAIEVKRSSAPTVSKGMHLAAADVQAHALFVVYPGLVEFPLGQKVLALPLGAMVARLVAAGRDP